MNVTLIIALAFAAMMIIRLIRSSKRFDPTVMIADLYVKYVLKKGESK